MAQTKKEQEQQPQAPPPPPPPPIKRVVVAVLPGKEELVASTPNQRNWRGILIALLVIVAVLGLIVFSIVLLSPPEEGPRVKGRKFTLDDVLGPHYRARRFNGTWVSEVELVYRDVEGGVTLFNAENLTTRILMTNSTFRQLNAVDFRVSSDLRYILLILDMKKVFRYSYEARYFIFEVQTSRKFELNLGGNDAESHPLLQDVVWAPRGNALAFVYRNDIYYKTSALTSHVYRITNTGQPGVVFNGVPDWLYEEEILKSPNALWFSPDAHFLLYASFNDSLVGELKYPWYGRIQERLRYPQIRMLRYPKAGTRNPAVTLWAVDLSRPLQLYPVDLKPPLVLKANSESEWDHYFTAVTWLSHHQVAVIWMNRVQNESIISLCRGPVWNCDATMKLEAEPRGWVELYDAPLFSSDGSCYLARLPVLEGQYGYYKHVCHIDIASRRNTPLTQGRFEVTKILAWDEENHFIYFVAAPEHKPGERHLYRTGDLNISSPDNREMDCLTCPPLDPSQSPPQHGLGPLHSTVMSGDISPDYNASELASWPPCLYVAPHLSPGLSPRFYVLECLGPDPPSASLVDLWSNTKLAVLDTQPALRDRLAVMASPQVKTIKVLVEGGYHAQVRLHLPPGLREDEEMTFPLILHVCAAPGSQLVSEQWSVDWGTYLASNRNFIVAQIDGRGSGFQGDRLLHEMHYRLGSVEIEDQIAVTKYLRDLKYVDRDRIAVWGWSYGGFATAMILAQDEKVFHCGISVAPITSWTHYDSVYTERYMGTPNVTDNYRGYEEADVTKRAGNLRNKLFLLVHGTADHTVHYQQSMMLVRALTDQGVLFRHQTYADEGHSFSGVQHHFYKAMESFLDDCFGPLDFEEWEIGTSFFTFKQ
ncbi:dipeptidyl peptidase 4 isoform X2 [Cryptotermes secundus]|uniref:dipeptidyl peptidase 4 isoform X2 n=1 Tax=Cryptotermes secundus TaxID=105785 RepID=UPI000CD7D7CC|nr:dipeptidyl peptidase 4 isoform X2 [Cryptotermes secundus]